ncbi:hypothetical protein C4J91_2312 [Pseudomonas sp. R3-52-08]|nr:hypothetical protein C4J91_2312 [Pseudomonas sp. R3-52-08]
MPAAVAPATAFGQSAAIHDSRGTPCKPRVLRRNPHAQGV